ncbi:MAG: DUF2085 domain-containing protein [candidate division Zixibacteria bacterium]|nr:DUF2085 domain-containing protein [candidate division Zixibacteria bacterium]
MDGCIEKDRKKSQQLSLCLPKSERRGRITSKSKDRLSLFLARNAEKLGLRVYHFVCRHWLGIINFHLLLFILGSISAPCLSYLGQEGIAKYIYKFYGISCHQIPSRSFFIFDHQIAICARCFSFFSSMLAFGLLISLKNVRPLNREIAFLLALSILIDVLLQTVGISESTNLLRVTTAVLLSLSLSFYIYPRIKASIECFTENTEEIF